MQKIPEKIPTTPTKVQKPIDFIQVEIAPSSRAQCRKCKTNIQKGEIRLAICYDDGITRSYPWKHLICFYLTNHYIQEKIQAGDIKGFKELNEDQQLKVEDRIIKLVNREIEEKSAKKKNKSEGKSKYIPEEDAILYKQGGYTAQQRTEFYQYLEEYGRMTLNELKAMLEYNQQPKTGVKQEVLERVADGWLLGSIPKCSNCQHGHLHFNRYNGVYTCKGFYDDTADHYRKCGKKYKRNQIQRDEFA